MDARLVYRIREGLLSGIVGGQSFRLATLQTHADRRILTWDKVQELPPHAATTGTSRRKLKVVENAPLEIYDRLGEHAQRCDTARRGGTGVSPGHRHLSRVIWVKLKPQTGFPGDGFHIHGPPFCGDERCIIIAQEWDSLFKALKTARQTTIVVEI